MKEQDKNPSKTPNKTDNYLIKVQSNSNKRLTELQKKIDEHRTSTKD